MVAPSNKAIDKLNTAVDSNSSKKIRAACKKVLAAEDRFMRDLDSARWPENVRPLVDDVISSVASERRQWLGCSQSTTRQELVDALSIDVNDPHEGAAQALRVRLGLPGTA